MAEHTTLSEDTLNMDEDEKKKKKKKTKKAAGGGAGQGAAAGATVGAAAGPVGALIGAGVGAAAGAVDANKAKKDAASAGPRPKRRKLAAGFAKFEETKRRKERALASLSQAVFDFANNLR